VDNNSPFNRKLIESIDKLTKALGDSEAAQQSRFTGGDEAVDYAKQLDELEKEQEKRLNRIKELKKKGLADQADLEEQILEDNKELLSVLYKQASVEGEISDDLVKQIKDSEKIVQAKTDALKIDQKAAGLVESYVERLTGIRDMSEEVSVLNARGLQQMAQGLAKLASAQNLAANASRTMVDETTLAVGRMMQARADFTRMTNLDNDEYAEQLIRITESARTLGIVYGEVGQTFGALQAQIPGFVKLSAAQQDSLIENAISLERLGVDTETTASLQSTFISVLGDVPSAATAAARSAVSMARDYGRSSREVISSIDAMIDRFASFGSGAQEIGEEITELSVRTGASADEIASFFETARDFRGGLEMREQLGFAGVSFDSDALFGSDINQALGELQRIALQYQSLADSGQQFLAAQVAAATGRPAAFLSRIANATRELSDEERTRINTQRELNEIARDAVGPTQKLQAVFNSFAIAVEPISDILIDILDGVAKFAEKAPDAFKAVGLIGTVLGGVLGAGGTIAGAGLLAKALGGIGAAITPLAIPMLAFGGAIALIATGIGVVAWGIGSMVESFGSIEEGTVTILESLLGTMAQALPALSLGALGLLTFTGFLTALGTYSNLADTEALSATADSFRNIHEAVQAVSDQPAAVATVRQLLDKAEDVADAQAQVEYSILADLANISEITQTIQGVQQSLNQLSNRPVVLEVDGRVLGETSVNYIDRQARRSTTQTGAR